MDRMSSARVFRERHTSTTWAPQTTPRYPADVTSNLQLCIIRKGSVPFFAFSVRALQTFLFLLSLRRSSPDPLSLHSPQSGVIMTSHRRHNALETNLKRVSVYEPRISSKEVHHQGSTVTVSRNVGCTPVPAVLCVHHALSRRHIDGIKLNLEPKP